ncbi:hypothetical protein ACLMAB_10325 [Brevibacillus laterosporus]
MNTMHEQLAMFPPVDEKAVRKVLLESKKIQSITGCCKESERKPKTGLCNCYRVLIQQRWQRT